MEYTFIQFSSVLESNSCVALPIVQPSDLAFFLDDATYALGVDSISALDKDGNVLQGVVEFDIVGNWVKLKGTFNFEVDKCFVLKVYKKTIVGVGRFITTYEYYVYYNVIYSQHHTEGYYIRLVKNTSLEGAVCMDIDNNTYDTVTVNGLTITTSNLRVTKFTDGTVIPTVTDDAAWVALSTPAKCAYDNNSGLLTSYGYLYNSFCLTGTKSIAPIGWHVITNDEWLTLYNYSLTNFGTSVNGAKALSTKDLWGDPDEPATEIGQIGYQDELNNFLLTNFQNGGCRQYDGTFIGAALYCAYWTINYGTDSAKYSNTLRLTTATDTTLLRYSCNEGQYGFDYTEIGSYNQVRLPIRIYAPQPLQEKTVYKGSDGVVHVLSATMKKEYLLETEYIPEQWHDNLVIALNHDTVTLDTVSLSNEEYDYSINWDEYTDTECSERLTKGSTKMQQNKINRNTNCE